MMNTMMKTLFTLLLIGTAFAKITKENDVLVLTDANFDEALNEHSGLLVEFYAPWCGHCKNLQPAYDAAAKQLAEKGLPLAKIDADAHKEAAGKYDVRGFPTIKYFAGGKPVEYSGGRATEDIVNYVIKKSGPAAAPLADAAAIEEFKGKGEAVVVGFFSDAESEGAKLYNEAANANDDLSFGIVTDAAAAKAFGVEDGTIVVLKTFDEKQNELKTSSSTTSEEVEEFISTYSLRLVTKFSPESSRAIFGGPVQVHALFFTKGEDLDGDLAEAATEAAKKTRGKLLHVHVPASETRVIEWFGITEDQMPTIMIADMEGSVKKYAFGDRPLTVAGVQEFEDDFLNKKLEPSLKSEEPTEEDLAEPVKVVKGKSFDSIVIDNDNDVLLEMYAPWCGHCKSLAPKYDELAAKLSGVKTITIAKMDATANEIDYEGAEVEGFPTLFFFKGGDKENVMKYEGDREVADFLSFLQENANTPFTLDGEGDDSSNGEPSEDRDEL